MKCEYKVERISNDLEKYLNEKGSQGWRCASVTTATGLGWTYIVVLERDEENQPVDTAIKIIESKSQEDEKQNGKVTHDSNLEFESEEAKSMPAGKKKEILEMSAKFCVGIEFAWIIINIVVPFICSLLDADSSIMDILQINPIQWIIIIIVNSIFLFIVVRDGVA